MHGLAGVACGVAVEVGVEDADAVRGERHNAGRTNVAYEEAVTRLRVSTNSEIDQDFRCRLNRRLFFRRCFGVGRLLSDSGHRRGFGRSRHLYRRGGGRAASGRAGGGPYVPSGGGRARRDAKRLQHLPPPPIPPPPHEAALAPHPPSPIHARAGRRLCGRGAYPSTGDTLRRAWPRRIAWMRVAAASRSCARAGAHPISLPSPVTSQLLRRRHQPSSWARGGRTRLRQRRHHLLLLRRLYDQDCRRGLARHLHRREHG